MMKDTPMRRIIASAVLAGFITVSTACYGPFNLTRNVYHWNSGVKGSGKSHLSKVVLLQLIARGAPCVVFDINREYIHLPKSEVDPVTGKTLRRGIVHLEAGGNFRLSVRQFGLAPMMTLMKRRIQ